MLKLPLPDKKFHISTLFILLSEYCAISAFVLLLLFSVTLSNIIFVVQQHQPNFPDENNTLSALLLNILVWAVRAAFMWAWIIKKYDRGGRRWKVEQMDHMCNYGWMSNHANKIWFLISSLIERKPAKAAKQKLCKQQRARSRRSRG